MYTITLAHSSKSAYHYEWLVVLSSVFGIPPSSSKKTGSCTISQSNDAPDLPASVSFGKALSQWENEFDEDECIVELVIGGAKSYSYKTNKGKVVIKQKGITMDVANTDVTTF